MKFWPFTKRETRAESYTDAVVTALLTRASGDVNSGHTGVREAIAGLWGRAFASAQAEGGQGAVDALDPQTLYQLGRDLCEQGRWIAEIGIGPFGLYLERADAFNVTGIGPPWTWEYELTFNRPSGAQTRTLVAGRVVDVRLGAGLAYSSPLQGAATTLQLMDNVEVRLGEETATGVGFLMPVPVGQKDALSSDIRGLKGKLGLVETPGSYQTDTDRSAASLDFEPKRVGADPPASLVALREDVQAVLFAAGGVPQLTSQQDGTAQREQLRRFLHSTISPVADIALVELRRKLDAPDLKLDFKRLYASDLAGRARAFGQLVTGGLDMKEAAGITGVLTDDNA